MHERGGASGTPHDSSRVPQKDGRKKAQKSQKPEQRTEEPFGESFSPGRCKNARKEFFDFLEFDCGM